MYYYNIFGILVSCGLASLHFHVVMVPWVWRFRVGWQRVALNSLSPPSRRAVVRTLQTAGPYLGSAGGEVPRGLRHHHRQDGLHGQRDRDRESAQLSHAQVLPCRRRAQGQCFSTLGNGLCLPPPQTCWDAILL